MFNYIPKSSEVSLTIGQNLVPGTAVRDLQSFLPIAEEASLGVVAWLTLVSMLTAITWCIVKVNAKIKSKGKQRKAAALFEDGETTLV